MPVSSWEGDRHPPFLSRAASVGGGGAAVFRGKGQRAGV